MDWGLWGQFSGVEETFGYSPSDDPPRPTQGFPSVLRHFTLRTWRSAYLGRKICFICVTIASTTWVELCYAWFEVSSRSACAQDMETFSHRKPLWCIYGSQKFEVHLHVEGVKPRAKEMVGAHKGLWHEIALSSRRGQCRSRCIEPQELC